MRRSSRILFKQEVSSAELEGEKPSIQKIECPRPYSVENIPSKEHDYHLAHDKSGEKKDRLKKSEKYRKLQSAKNKIDNTGKKQADLNLDSEESNQITSTTIEIRRQIRFQTKTGNAGKRDNNSHLQSESNNNSNDSVPKDVVNSLKIDRKIKNLSPKKFFVNKKGKTTRSGRSFSPYDFASYSASFGTTFSGRDRQSEPTGNDCAKEGNENCDLVRKNLDIPRDGRRMKKSRASTTSHKNKSKVAAVKKPRRPYTKRSKPHQMLPDTYHSPLVSPTTSMGIDRGKLAVREEITHLAEEDPGFSFEFPPTPDSYLEGHSLPPNFYASGNIISPECIANELNSETWLTPPVDSKYNKALSEVRLSHADKYEFKSVFKDISAQIANFEHFSGQEIRVDSQKYDLLESESVEGKRFYRKRITDTRLIAWHKYNLVSSTNFWVDSNPLPSRPVIKIRSNPCQKADQVWRMNQMLPPPSIDDVINGANYFKSSKLKK